MSAGAVRDEVRDFAVRLLERAGGAVDWPSCDAPGEAVVPDDLAALLRARGETVALSAEPAPDAVCVSLAGDFLDVAEQVLASAVPRVARLAVPERSLKKGELQETLERVYTWHNARVRVQDSRPAEVEYHTWWFHAALRSEEAWEARTCVTVNAWTLAEVEFPDPLDMPGAQTSGDTVRARDASGVQVAETLPVAAARAQRKLLEEAAGFLERLDGRRARDQKRLRDYYNSLLREAKTPSRRLKTAPTPEEIEARTRAVQQELRRKLGELDERYAIDGTLRPIAIVCTRAPALAVDIEVQRKQAHRTYTLYWNSLLRRFEPLACSRCGASTCSLTVTNETVDVLCTPCSVSDSPAGRKPR
jgi:hypothetical protein